MQKKSRRLLHPRDKRYPSSPKIIALAAGVNRNVKSPPFNIGRRASRGGGETLCPVDRKGEQKGWNTDLSSPRATESSWISHAAKCLMYRADRRHGLSERPPKTNFHRLDFSCKYDVRQNSPSGERCKDHLETFPRALTSGQRTGNRSCSSANLPRTSRKISSGTGRKQPHKVDKYQYRVLAMDAAAHFARDPVAEL